MGEAVTATTSSSNRVPQVERDVVTIRAQLDYPKKREHRDYIAALEALDRLARKAHEADLLIAQHELAGQKTFDHLPRAQMSDGRPISTGPNAPVAYRYEWQCDVCGDPKYVREGSCTFFLDERYCPTCK